MNKLNHISSVTETFLTSDMNEILGDRNTPACLIASQCVNGTYSVMKNCDLHQLLCCRIFSVKASAAAFFVYFMV